MAESSFYGGRPGSSCVIVKYFLSVEEMVNSFKLGGNYSDVHYNEYVLINTENKNNPHNGEIYRRGYDYTNENGGAIYVGTIVGPAGQAPQLEMTTVEKVKEKKESEDYDGRYTEGEYKPTVDLVPGKSGEKYNDSIKWAAYSMRDSDKENTTVYLGFIFPYLVEEFVAAPADAYKTTGLISREDEDQHPFYQKWKINIPKGIKGDTLKNLRVMTADGTIEDYSTKQEDISKQRKVLVYDYYTYDNNSTGIKKVIYVGNYNVIKDISLNEEGTVTIHYTYDEDDVFNHAFKCVKTISIDETGALTFTYNDKTSETLNQKIKWITDVQVKTDAGEGEGTGDQKVHVTYNDKTEKVIGQGLNYIMDTVIDKNFHLLVYYSDPDKRNKIPQDKKVIYNGKNDWLDLGSVKDEDGILIGLNIDINEHSDVATFDGAIKYLNDTYPNGLTDSGLEGKIVTVGDESNPDNKEFYAFDYDSKTWYFLGTFDIQMETLVMIEKDIEDSNIEKKKTTLIPGGIWFVLEGEDN